jgi:putative peptidoglycan lipid II flippase
MVAVFLSRFLGLIRDRLLVHNFSTAEASIFFAAFKLPDLMFQLLILGTLSVAFIPVYTEYLNKDGEKEAFSFASNILNLSLVVFGILGIVSMIFVSQINSLFVPGFSGDQKILTDQLTQIILIAQLILVVGSFFIGLSQSYQRFLVPALAPLFYNVGIIFGIAVLSPYFGIMGPAYGVIIGSLAHVLVQIPLIKSLGFKYTFSLDFLNKGVREVFKLMSVRNIGLAAEQVSDANKMKGATK